MSGLLDGLMQELGSSGVSAIAGKLGMDSGQTENAIQSALPMIIGAMSRNSNDPQGAQSLRNALQQHANDAPVQQKVHQVTEQAEPDNDAAAILGHIFGSKQTAAAQGVSHASGIDSGNAMNLMGMLAPLIMSYLGKQTQQQNMDAGQISNELGQQASSMQSGGIGSLVNAVLDSDGDGSPDFSSILNIGSSILGSFGRK